MNETSNETNQVCFIKSKLNQWFTNEEIFKILTETTPNAFSAQSEQLPKNGSVFIFDRKLVKNYKKDGFAWKCRKTANKSVREDRMVLKINGQVSIYGCYSHSCLIPSFHRRIYWLLSKPDIVLVHYLQIPNNNSNNSNNEKLGESLITFESIGTDIQLTYDQVDAQLRSMLWPHYLNKEFVSENMKLNCGLSSSSSNDEIESIDLITFICNQFYMMKNTRSNNSSFVSNRIINDSFKISFNNLKSIELLNKNEISINNKFAIHKNFNTNIVKLSINFCSNKGNETLMLISNDWNDCKTYQMIINEKILTLKQLNKHVFETFLPRFDNIDKETNALNTFISIYENQQLFCENIPFEIRNDEINKCALVEDKQIDYKNQFFLLERILIIFKYFKCKKLMDDSNPVFLNDESLSFENRACNLIELLIEYLNVFKTLNNNSNKYSCSSTQFLLNNINEGKNLVNLCVDLGFLKLFKILHHLKTSLFINSQYAENEDFSLLKNESDLFNFDHHATNSLMLICQKGKTELGAEAVKWLEEDLHMLKSDKIPSWILSIHKSKELAIIEIVGLNELIQKAENKLNESNQQTSYDLAFIDNLDELTSFLNDDEHLTLRQTNVLETDLEPLETITATTTISINQYNDCIDDFINENNFMKSEILIDDQDEKIKTIADNIIAAMPNRIKIQNRYSISNRNSTSLDENNLETMNENSSNRSSLSFTSSSQSFQLTSNPFINIQIKDPSPDPTCTVVDELCVNSSSFHIDSPPSTAEFCQYFHANSFSSIESGFAQLCLTDAEQAELYEAALVIQNAYRRYMFRKKIKLNNSNQFDLSSKSNSFDNSNHSLFNNEKNKIDTQIESGINNLNKNNNEQKQYEAACVIQKFYRRYKQYENIQKYNDAASKIQKSYRTYKLSKSSATNNSIIDTSSISTLPDPMFNLPINQKLISRKLVNVRPNSRFSPSSPGGVGFQSNTFTFDQYHNIDNDTDLVLFSSTNIKSTVDQFMESIDFLNNR